MARDQSQTTSGNAPEQPLRLLEYRGRPTMHLVDTAATEAAPEGIVVSECGYQPHESRVTTYVPDGVHAQVALQEDELCALCDHRHNADGRLAVLSALAQKHALEAYIEANL